MFLKNSDILVVLLVLTLSVLARGTVLIQHFYKIQKPPLVFTNKKYSE